MSPTTRTCTASELPGPQPWARWPLEHAATSRRHSLLLPHTHSQPAAGTAPAPAGSGQAPALLHLLTQAQLRPQHCCYQAVLHCGAAQLVCWRRVCLCLCVCGWMAPLSTWLQRRCLDCHSPEGQSVLTTASCCAGTQTARGTSQHTRSCGPARLHKHGQQAAAAAGQAQWQQSQAQAGVRPQPSTKGKHGRRNAVTLISIGCAWSNRKRQLHN